MVTTPESLESVQWTGDNLADIDRFVGASCTVVTGRLLRVAAGAAGFAGADLAVPLGSWVVRLQGELRVLEQRIPVAGTEQNDNLTSPNVERFVDHLAYEGGYD